AVAPGRGRRDAGLAGHGKHVARKARGLEAALVENGVMSVFALERSDTRSFQMRVAGPAALLIAKMHKLKDRSGGDDRLAAKDTLDVLRLLRGVATEEIAAKLRGLAEDRRSADVTTEGV